MSDNDPRSHWWALYAVLPLTVGLFVLEVNTAMSPVWHQVAEIGIVLFAFIYVELWLSANTLALMRRDDDWRRQAVGPDKSRLHIVPKPAKPSGQCDFPEDREVSGKLGARLAVEAPVNWLRSFACHLSIHL
jgi:hypothetical protein